MSVTLRDYHCSLVQRFVQAGLDNPSLESRLLLCHILGLSSSDFIIKADEVFDMKPVEALVSRRLSGEPFSKIVGEKEFWSYTFFTSTDTLDPRPDSEVLIESVLSHILNRSDPLRILDMGVGTGCLLLTLLLEYPNAEGVGLDISKQALSMAEKNAKRYGLTERAFFTEGEFGAVLDQPFDLVISNPPYIPSADIDELQTEVKKFDPMLALDGGIDGLNPYKILAKSLPKNLKENGFFVLEFGIGQADDVCKILQESHLRILNVNRDLGNRQRCVIGQNQS